MLEQAFAQVAHAPSPDELAWLTEAGDAWVTAGRSSRALRVFTQAQSAASAQAAADPSNTQWQEALSISLEKIGEALTAQGNLRRALERFQAALDIREKRAAADPASDQLQRDLAVGKRKIGETLTAQGDPSGALTSLQGALAVSEKLASADPFNTAWQRDLAVTHHRIGETLRAQGDLAGSLGNCQAALAISEKLAAADPSNRVSQRDVAIAYRAIGDTLRAQDDLTGALQSYRAALDISKKLVATDPTNTVWLRDMAVACRGVGETLTAQGDLAGALGSYRAALGISERLAVADPSNTLWRHDLSRSNTLIRQNALKRRIESLVPQKQRQKEQQVETPASELPASSMQSVAVREPQTGGRTESGRRAPASRQSPVADSLILGLACFYVGRPWITGFIGTSVAAIAAEEAGLALIGGSVGLYVYLLSRYCKERAWGDRQRFLRSFLVIQLPGIVAMGVAFAGNFETLASAMISCAGVAGALCTIGLLEMRMLKRRS
jgi:tetratricopeptide (TPR) repeat protein